MSAQQESRLSRLRPGEAFFFFNKLEEPEEVMTENYRLENKIDITLSDAEIARLSTYWKERQQLLRPYPECAYSKHCQHRCDYSRRILAKEIARRIFNHYILTAKAQSNSKKDIIDAQKTAIKQVLSQIISLSRNEAPDEEITPELLICIKLHLFRKIKYETSIQFGESMIQNSLTK